MVGSPPPRRMHQCPKCGSVRVHYSRTKTTWEKLRRRVTGKRPYRCGDCRVRTWTIDSGPHYSADAMDAATRALAPEPPNLANTALARDERRPQTVDLRKLDLP